MRKKQIQQRFSANRGTYEQNATAQAYVAEKLFSLIIQHIGLVQNHQKILEIGCGTGLFTRYLFKYSPTAEFFLNDLGGDHLLLSTPSPYSFLPGDAEKIDFPENLDIIASSSALQWFENPAVFLKKAYTALSPGCFMALSTFGPENLTEIRQLTGNGLHYPSLSEIRQMMEQAGFQIIREKEERLELPYDSPLHILRHLRYTGVNAGFSTHWTKRKLEHFCAEYQRRFPLPKGEKLTYQLPSKTISYEVHREGVMLTYHPYYLIAQKLPS